MLDFEVLQLQETVLLLIDGICVAGSENRRPLASFTIFG